MDELLEMPPRLSPSAADTWHQCPKKWWGKYIAKIEDPAGPAAEMGTLVHSALEYLYNQPPDYRSRASAMAALKLYGKAMTREGKFQSVDDPTAFFREALTRLLVIWKVEDPASINVIQTEMGLDTHVGGVPFRGYIDRIEYVDGEVVISDYKTGKRPQSMYRGPKDKQIRLYVIATENQTDLEVSGGQLIWLNANGAVWPVDSSPEALEDTTYYFQNVWEEMAEAAKTGYFEERTSPLCGWCPVLSQCSSGKAFVKARAKEGRLKETAPAWEIAEQWQ